MVQLNTNKNNHGNILKPSSILKIQEFTMVCLSPHWSKKKKKEKKMHRSCLEDPGEQLTILKTGKQRKSIKHLASLLYNLLFQSSSGLEEVSLYRVNFS